MNARSILSFAAVVRESGQSAVWMHKFHGKPQELIGVDLCGESFSSPYLHFIYLIGEEKEKHAKYLGLWFLQPDSNSEFFKGSKWSDLVIPPESALPEGLWQNFTLPCNMVTVPSWLRLPEMLDSESYIIGF